MNKHDRRKRDRGLLRLFILRSLTKTSKSGYDILKEIETKTEGEWHPSKGTIYPILSELEKEGFILAVEEGARARRAFRTTKSGAEHLEEVVGSHRSDHRKRMAGRRLLFEETFFDETERRLLRLGEKVLAKAFSSSNKKRSVDVLHEALKMLEEDQ